MFYLSHSPSSLTVAQLSTAQILTSSSSSPSSSSTTLWIDKKENSTISNTDTYQPFSRIMWYRFLLIIIIFVTAIGNLLVCLAIARERKLQNTTNYFLMSLSIADCLVAILVMPMGMIAEVIGHFPLPHYACIIFATMDVLCCTSSIWHMSTMSMDRYFTIRFPFRYGRNKTRRIMFLKIIAVWAMSAAISSPVFVLGLMNKQNVLSNGVCAPNNASFKIYGSIFAFYIPFVIMITTYALTMRSLKNVLVSKKKYDRERRRKQTFRPLAQVVNQYVEIAQGLRRTSSANSQRLSEATITINNNNVNNNDNNSISNKTFFTIKKATSPTDSRASLFSLNNANVNLHQDTMLKDVTNENNFNNESLNHNSQHLSITYAKSNGNKTRCYQQSTFTTNANMHRKESDIDMSTVYETTECSKSTSSSNDGSITVNSNITRKSACHNEHQALFMRDTTKSTELSNRAISTMNDASTLEEEEEKEEASHTNLNMHNEPSTFEAGHLQLTLSSFQHVASTNPDEPIFLTIPWAYYFNIIHFILQYYKFHFHHRLYPLPIEYSSTVNRNSSKIDQSTSTSSIHLPCMTSQQSVSTQTTSFSALDYSNLQLTSIHESRTPNSPKRRKFPFKKPKLPASSLFTNLFHHFSSTPIRSSYMSSKSSSSSDQRSSAVSSSNLIRERKYLPKHISRIESEIEPVSTTLEHRLRTSTSTSSLLHTTCRYGSHTYTHYHEPLRRQPNQFQSTHIIPNSSNRRHQHQQKQQLSSVTNTNSSDSSSAIYHFPSRVLSTVSNQQRTRDEDIVAANERKALRVLMIMFSVFITLWTPFFICTFISAICEQCRERLSSTVWFSITWLGYSSSMANPFIYTIFSDAFRRAFMNIIFCRSTEASVPGQCSTKLSSPKHYVHRYMNHNLSCRRSPNQDISDASTPILLHRFRSAGGSDAKIYINRYASELIR